MSSVYDVLGSDDLSCARGDELRPFLPYVVARQRALEQQHGGAAAERAEALGAALLQYPHVEWLEEYMRADAAGIARDLCAELGTCAAPQSYAQSRYAGECWRGDLARGFEQAPRCGRLRLLAGELVCLLRSTPPAGAAARPLPPYESDLLNEPMYKEELCVALPVALARFSSLLPLRAVSRALLRVSQACAFLFCVAANTPSGFADVVSVLIEGSEFNDSLQSVLGELGKLSERCALFIRSALVEQRKLLPLALALTIDHLHDEVVFVTGLLRSDPKWLATLPPESPGVARFHDALMSRLLPEDTPAVMVNAALFAVCGLVGVARLQLAPAHASRLLRLASRTTSQRTAKLGLCFVLTCPDITSVCSQAEVTECLRQLMAGGLASEMLFLIGIHAHSGDPRFTQIVNLVQKTLDLPVEIDMASIAKICTIFSTELFTEATLAEQVEKLPVCSNLSAESYSPVVGCVYHLLRSGIVNASVNSIGRWVLAQVLECVLPLHPLMPQVIFQFVKLLHNCDGKVDPIPTETILQVFGIVPDGGARRGGPQRSGSAAATWWSAMRLPAGGAPVPAQVLILYYVLQYNEQNLAYRLRNPAKKASCPREYSPALLYSIPVKHLLAQAQAYEKSYATTTLQLLSLVASQFPQLLEPAILLEELEYKANTQSNTEAELPEGGSTVTVTGISEALRDPVASPTRAHNALSQLEGLSLAELTPFTDVLLDSLLPTLLKPEFEDEKHHVVRRFVSLWEKLFTQRPWELCLRTINLLQPPPQLPPMHALQPQQPRQQQHQQLEHTGIVSDPLVILRCDARVYRSALFVRILLKIIALYLTASRKSLLTQALVASAEGSSARQEELSTLALAQDSAVVQLLLEACLGAPGMDPGALEELRTHVCRFVHQMFIDNPLMIKLVHFQGYSEALVPVTVEGVPSLHVCLDFLPELLAQQQLEKVLFAVHLASHLVQKYPVPKSLAVARAVLQRLQNYHCLPPASEGNDSGSGGGSGSGSGAAQFLVWTLPALERLCAAFPVLAEDCLVFLLELGEIAKGELGRDTSLAKAVRATYDHITAAVVEIPL
eukprot:TRINITY_DN1197_c0_g2_i1.p1 TRINITY_DN1197_c0_g2~~TRINITY_DN1197_c0_g2_i1.p1  ORF type:complete len:1069 (-),score=277.21 TRINITY_DN1197_c0_g2_i1:53-3259(-)